MAQALKFTFPRNSVRIKPLFSNQLQNFWEVLWEQFVCVGGDGCRGGGNVSPFSNSESPKAMAKKLDGQIVIIPGMSPLRSAKEGCPGSPDFPKILKLPKLTKKYP